jgi:protein SCO1/2
VTRLNEDGRIARRALVRSSLAHEEEVAMNTRTMVIGALILTGAGLTVQAASGAEAVPSPAADAQMTARDDDATMKTDEAKDADPIANAVANENAKEEAAAKEAAKEDAAKDDARDDAKDDAKTNDAASHDGAADAADAAPAPAVQKVSTDSAEAMPANMQMDSTAKQPADDTPAPGDAAPAREDQSKDQLHSMAAPHDASEEHAHHHVMPASTTRETVAYALPPVKLVRDDGKAVSLTEELDDGRPVVLTFIYTSCTTICPIISQVFEQLQQDLGSENKKVHMVSISIDPEEDTPTRLHAYAQRFGAGPEWQYYTGTVEASVATQRAFNVYRGDKMNHTPVAFLRAAPGKPWLRIDGLASADELLSAYHEVVASTGS